LSGTIIFFSAFFDQSEVFEPFMKVKTTKAAAGTDIFEIREQVTILK
jgi:hypothetical protein